MKHHSLETLKSIDPATGNDGRSSNATRERMLREVLRLPTLIAPGAGPRPVRRLRWALVGLTAATTLTVAVSTNVLFGPNAQPARAVTPSALNYKADGKSLKEVLGRLALVARKDTYSVPAESTVYVKRDMWALSTLIDGFQVRSAIIPTQRETWKKPDGSVSWKEQTKPPQFQNAEQKEVWEDAGAIGEDPEFTEGSSAPKNGPQDKPAPEDARSMGSWLFANHENAGSGELFDSVSAHNLNEFWNGRQRAALFDLLATRPDVKYRGSVTDRAGRTGQAVSVDSNYGGLPGKHTLIFDESNGRLFAYEEELTTDAGALNVDVPSVTLYICYLTARAE